MRGSAKGVLSVFTKNAVLSVMARRMVYANPRTCDSLEPLIDATWENMRHPILRTRDYDNARVCYNAMGHGVEAFEHPVNQVLLQRGALWVLGKLGASSPRQNSGAPGQ